MPSDQSFLGTGWSFPPTFGRGQAEEGGAEVEMATGPEDIHQSLQILLSTGLGERVMQEEFGCEMNSLLFEEIDQGLLNSLNSIVLDAILYHEPRITLDELDITESETEPGLLLIRIDYTIRGTNSRFNMVYPFYINEATTPG